MAIKSINLPSAVQAWDYSDVASFALALKNAGADVRAWHISSEGNEAYLFAAKSSKPPSRKVAAKALLAWYESTGNSGLTFKEVEEELNLTFKQVR